MKGLVERFLPVDPHARRVSRTRGLRHWPAAGSEVPTAALARIAADHGPAVGDDGPAAVLGPWADRVPVDAWGRQARRIAAAAMAFAASMEVQRTPIRSWMIGRPRPSKADREAVFALTRSPWWPMGLEAAGGGRWSLTPLAGWGDDLPVPGPVSLAHAGGVAGGPAPGRVALVRLVIGPHGPVAGLPLVLPPGVEGRLEGAVHAVQAAIGGPRPPAEGMSAAGHVLARLLHESAPP